MGCLHSTTDRKTLKGLFFDLGKNTEPMRPQARAFVSWGKCAHLRCSATVYHHYIEPEKQTGLTRPLEGTKALSSGCHRQSLIHLQKGGVCDKIYSARFDTGDVEWHRNSFVSSGMQKPESLSKIKSSFHTQVMARLPPSDNDEILLCGSSTDHSE